jgi:hypothetical protein
MTYKMGVYLGRYWLFSQLSEFLSQNFLLIRVDVLVAEEDNAPSRHYYHKLSTRMLF